MINNKVIENELKETEKQIEDLLLRIKELRKEVHDMLPPEVKKVVHERVVLDRKNCHKFIELEEYFHTALEADTRTINIVRYKEGYVGKYDSYAYLGIYLSPINYTNKNQVIMTYIPSENIILVVEL